MTLSSAEKNNFIVKQTVNRKALEQRQEILKKPGFGRYFTDHMCAIDWQLGKGWHDARIEPYGPLLIDPAASVLHYGQEIFEGLKAYRHADGSIWTFRPDANARRFQLSAQRLALPELPIDVFIESIKQLVEVDQEWVPNMPETSLYLRPFMISNESFLGVRAAEVAAYYVIASPSGSYFENGMQPVSIWLSGQYSRVGKGGTGEAKCGGNYAASLLPQAQAYAKGCSQVLFLDAEQHTYIEELGGMNVFLVHKDGTLITPKTSGSILKGITRDSIIHLAKDMGMQVQERKVSVDEWRDGVTSGDITEVFACGTAAVIASVNELKSNDFTVGDKHAQAGNITTMLRKELTDIQYG